MADEQQRRHSTGFEQLLWSQVITVLAGTKEGKVEQITSPWRRVIFFLVLIFVVVVSSACYSAGLIGNGKVIFYFNTEGGNFFSSVLVLVSGRVAEGMHGYHQRMSCD